MMNKTNDELLSSAKQLGLWGLVNHWDELCSETWPAKLIELEEVAQKERSLQRRLAAANLKKFKLMSDFDWTWPTEINRELVEYLFSFQFLEEAANVVLIGPKGVGKTMIAKNLAYQALLKGHTVRFTTASEMLNELAAKDGNLALQRRLRFFCQPNLLVIDEVGYLSYDNRHADLLFEIISRRYQEQSIIITTNKIFTEWTQVFPNASSVVALIDRLVHKAEITKIEGESFRYKEAQERAELRTKKTNAKKQKREK